ncbi:MAG: DUF2254 domain-containing protein [Deltaproteobacteria bacterium]|nr:DUF2254 domain-containing protein [Deltaproteobacteria bacterium]
MPLIPQKTGPRFIVLASLIGLTLGTALVYGLLWVAEFAGETAPDLIALWSSPHATNMLSNLAEVTVGVMAIALTVVAILVQLAAYRYTARITDLFVRDPVNMIAVGFFVVTSVLVLWINMSLEGLTGPSVMVMALVAMVSLAILGLLPYFAYIFYFLTPSHIIRLIREESVHALERASRLGDSTVERSRRELLLSIEHLDDMTQDAVKKDDKAIAIRTIGAMSGVLHAYAGYKTGLPKSWFSTTFLATHDADFVALDPDMIEAIEQRRTWVEMKVLRGLETTFRNALKRLTDVNHLIAIHCRDFAIHAVEANDAPALQLGIRYFNTFVRHAINAGDLRSAYNVLNEYRELAVELMRQRHDDKVVRIAEHLKYYANLAFARGHTFVVETIAHDVSEVLQIAHKVGSPCHDPTLEVLLDIDREPFRSDDHQEASLRGVRKAQVRLATYYLNVGATERARRVYEDMKDETPTRLRSIWQELTALHEAEWWEVANRDSNWDYLSPDRRAQLDVFFGWFDLTA